MKKIIIFGAGYYGKCAYYKLTKNGYSIDFYVDNNVNIQGTKIEGVKVLSPQELEGLYSADIYDIVVCSKAYYIMVNQLISMGILEYYIMLEGLLYHSSQAEMMMPVELCKVELYHKNSDEKNILFVQNVACIRTHKIAMAMKKNGYKVFLLYTLMPPQDSCKYYEKIYDKIFTVYTINQMINFVNNSDFDLVHSSNEPDLLTNILNHSNKCVIYDCHDMSSGYKSMSPEEMVMEQFANSLSDGVIYTTEGIRNIAIQKYGLKKENTFVLSNLISEDIVVEKEHKKLSYNDGEIHCVYEGGISTDQESHRYFFDIWKKIVEANIHIHFYSPNNIDECKKLEQIDEKIHYEGNISSKELASELTKYDIGLCILNVTEKNKQYLEYASPNKIQEYVNAKLPVAVGKVESQINYVHQNEFGKYLDFEKDIMAQMKNIKNMVIEANVLANRGLTFEKKIKELIQFYEKRIWIKNEDSNRNRSKTTVY